MKLTLKAKFICLGAALVAAAAVTEWLNYEDDLNNDKAAIMVDVMQRHMDADMKHDGIRGNVYSALVGAKTGNQQLLKTSQDEVKEMVEEFVKDVEDNIASDIPEDIKQQFIKIKQSVAEYADTSLKISAEAGDFDKAVAMLPQFNQVFGMLEEDQGKATDMLMTWSKTLHDSMASSGSRVRIILTMLLVLSICVPLLAAFGVFRPLKQMMQAMESLANSDTSVSIPCTGRTDEMGEIARTVQVFKDNAIKVQQMGAEQEEQQKRASEERRSMRLKMAQDFEGSVKSVVDMVASAATEMDATAKQVASIADTSKHKLGTLASEVTQATSNVQSVASATTELSSAINEINKQVSRATTITQTAVGEAQAADGTVQQLAAAAQKIGEVVNMINSIAEQINLLALNATIEAARAGDAGKGFAVVASEVKSLATQTTKATDEITSYISSIQSATNDTVAVIKSVGNTIREINEISTAIAAAVEEQGVATQDIASNVQQASDSTSSASRGADDVAVSANETGDAANQMTAATGELSKQAEILRREVDKFLSGVRAA